MIRVRPKEKGQHHYALCDVNFSLILIREIIATVSLCHGLTSPSELRKINVHVYVLYVALLLSGASHTELSVLFKIVRKPPRKSFHLF